MSNFTTTPLEGGSQACYGCGSFDIEHNWGGAPLCANCYQEVTDTTVGNVESDERLLGLILECECILDVLNKEVFTPVKHEMLYSLQDKVIEAKKILSVTGTGEAKELADVSEEEV